MKRERLVPGLLLVSCSLSVAGDREDVEARIKQHYQFWREKQDEKWVATYLTPGFVFAPPGGFFGDPETIEDVRANIPNWDWHNPVVRFDFYPRYIQVAIYGNGTVGIAHYYRMGFQTDNKGATRPISLRASDVWIKEAGVWRLAHRHLSPLVVGQTSN